MPLPADCRALGQYIAGPLLPNQFTDYSCVCALVGYGHRAKSHNRSHIDSPAFIAQCNAHTQHRAHRNIRTHFFNLTPHMYQGLYTRGRTVPPNGVHAGRRCVCSSCSTATVVHWYTPLRLQSRTCRFEKCVHSIQLDRRRRLLRLSAKSPMRLMDAGRRFLRQTLINLESKLERLVQRFACSVLTGEIKKRALLIKFGYQVRKTEKRIHFVQLRRYRRTLYSRSFYRSLYRSTATNSTSNSLARLSR